MTWNWKNKRVLVTGSHGFLGRNLVTRLQKEGANLSLVSHRPTALRSLKDEFFAFDVEEEPFGRFLKNNIKRFDVIYHLGSSASKQDFIKSPTNMMVKTLRGISNIADAVTDTNTIVVFPSSSSVYGNLKGEASELQPPRPVDQYAICKLAAERILITAAKNLIILRITNGYGPSENKGAYSSPITQFCRQILENEPITIFGNGSQKRDFIYISDVINIMVKSVESRQFGVLNVGTGQSHSFTKLATKISQSAYRGTSDIIYTDEPEGYVHETKMNMDRLRNWYNEPMKTLDEGIKLVLDEISKEKIND